MECGEPGPGGARHVLLEHRDSVPGVGGSWGKTDAELVRRGERRKVERGVQRRTRRKCRKAGKPIWRWWKTGRERRGRRGARGSSVVRGPKEGEETKEKKNLFEFRENEG